VYDRSYLGVTEDVLLARNMIDYVRRVNRQRPWPTRSLIYYGATRVAKTLAKRFGQDAAGRMRPLTAAEAAVIEANGRRYQEHVRSLVRLCQADHVQPVLITVLHDEQGMPAYVTAGLTRHNALLRELAAEEHAELIDLERAFAQVPDKGRYLFQDHYHPNRQGAAYIADHVAEALTARRIVSHEHETRER